jgi:hypothetical protein
LFKIDFLSIIKNDDNFLYNISKSLIDGLPFDVDIRLNLRAFVILKQEYPMAVSFIKQEPKTNNYRLIMSINNPKPVVRFVLGLLDDVEIIGSVAFKDYLKHYVFTTLENNKSDFEN